MQALLQHLAQIARPAEGAPKILVPIARIASSDCDWLEGGLTVEVTGSGNTTHITVSNHLGGGVRELLFPRLTLEVPKLEFLKAVKLAPVLVFPMKSRLTKEGLVLYCEAEVAGTVPPPSFEIAEASVRRSLAPAIRNSLAPLTDHDELKIEMPAIGEADLLARNIPKRPPLPRFDGIDLDPTTKTKSKRPAKPRLDELDDVDLDWRPTAQSKSPAKPRLDELDDVELDWTPTGPSKAAPARTSKAPAARTSKAPPARTSKAPPVGDHEARPPPKPAPPRPFKAPPRGKVPLPSSTRRSGGS